MKRIAITTILVLMLSVLVTGPVSAQKGKVNINGQVTEVGGGTITVLTNKGETFVVSLPAGFAGRLCPDQGCFGRRWKMGCTVHQIAWEGGR